MKKTIAIFMLSLVSMFSFAQSEPEYLMEIGAGAGLMSYEGDFNGNVFGNMQPSASIVLRRLLNPRQGFKLQLGYGKLKGSAADINTFYPEYPSKGEDVYSFSNSLVDLDATYEYNFWPFGTGKEYRGAKRLTPYVFGGLGLTFATGNDNSVFTMNLPVGAGVKYKLGDRLNVNLDWTMHFTMSDKLDGVVDPYLVERNGIFKNADCYSTLMVTFSYSFMEKCRVCHNQDE